MMWCSRCNEAVEPEEQISNERLNVNVDGYYETKKYVCPYCGAEVHQEPSSCVMCDCATAPSENPCDSCIEDIQAYVTLLAEYRNIEEKAVKDGLTEYLNMEDRK